MNASPLSLLQYNIEKFSIEPNENFNDGNTQEKFSVKTIKTHRVHKDDPKKSFITLDISVLPDAEDESSFPYKLSLSIMGFFEVEESFFEKDQGKIADINGSSILYGAAREFILSITARGRFGSFTLPTTTFIPRKDISKKELEPQSDEKLEGK